jgi:hypothetical protein
MDLDPGSLLASLLVSSVGFVSLVYGRKMARLPHVVAGLFLLVVSFVVPGALLKLASAAALVAMLWFAVRNGW